METSWEYVEEERQNNLPQNSGWGFVAEVWAKSEIGDIRVKIERVQVKLEQDLPGHSAEHLMVSRRRLTDRLNSLIITSNPQLSSLRERYGST